MFDAPRDMSAALYEELRAALGAFTIHSQAAFSFSDEPPIDITPQLVSGWGTHGSPTSGEGGETILVRAIQNTFYNRCYAHRLGEPLPLAGEVVTSDPEFARRLAAANAGRERWDKGWIIQQIAPNGQVFVRKGERERAAMPGTFVFEGLPGMALQIGGQVSLRAVSEALDAQPGYYFAFGDTLDELADYLSLVRLYFHCDADGGVLLMQEITAAFNRFQVPFQLKLPAAPRAFNRTDAAVLYIGARYFTIAARIVAPLRERLSLAESVPLFTKSLWPGVGVAVEPGNGESFGTHRSRLAAEGVVDAWRQGAQDAPARLARVAARFAAAGLDLARPYLGPDGIDLFVVPESARLP